MRKLFWEIVGAMVLCFLLGMVAALMGCSSTALDDPYYRGIYFSPVSAHMAEQR